MQPTPHPSLSNQASQPPQTYLTNASTTFLLLIRNLHLSILARAIRIQWLTIPAHLMAAGSVFAYMASIFINFLALLFIKVSVLFLFLTGFGRSDVSEHADVIDNIKSLLLTL
jgi:hypothetical protein